MKIDIHNHILPKKIPAFAEKFGYGGFITLKNMTENTAQMYLDDGTFFREIEKNCWDLEQRIIDQDKNNISVQVLSTVPVMFNYWAKPEDNQQVSRFVNEDMADVISMYPKRFIGLGTVPLQDPTLAAEELNFCIKELGFPGVQIGSHIGKVNLDDSSLYPFYEEAEKLDASILVHPWDMMGKETMEKYWLPWLVGMPAEVSRAICSMIFGGIFDKFPKLKVLFAHSGGSFLGTLGRIDHGFRSRPDLCGINILDAPSKYLDKFYIDSITHDPKALNYAIKLMGVNRIALGSDYPFPLGELDTGKMIEQEMPELSDSDRKRLAYGTALEWLGIKEDYFG